MNLKLLKSKVKSTNSYLAITGSKSESNRLLLLQALYPQLEIKNLSNSDDTQVMQNALQSDRKVIDVHHAGTAMRFLTAYFATQEGRRVIIKGSKRMHERPIKILVDALKILGAEITYLESQECPPLEIKGKSLNESTLTMAADVSSQYISALLLVAPSLPNGLELRLKGKITSRPYIEMTLRLLNQIGIETSFEDNIIKVKLLKELKSATRITVESDWSSASYFYSIVALGDVETSIKLSSYREDSLQGDSSLAEIYKNFGVQTTFENDTITLEKRSTTDSKTVLNFDLVNTPDLAQTIAVTCLGLKIPCVLTGLHTLKIKETDRLLALKNELEKFGAKVSITENTLKLDPEINSQNPPEIHTYNDHRMAMAFAPLALKTPLSIMEAEVVSKSYPDFWDDLRQIGFHIEE